MKTYAFIDASNLFYGGVKSLGWKIDEDGVDIKKLKNYLVKLIKNEGKKFTDAQLILFDRHLKKVKFYAKLQEFGYKLILKPVKIYHKNDGTTEKKAN